ncbi:MAG: hypothetical protein CFE24_14550 [Flavobacterium sp. BFFFF2]|nr:MAG: hypothetical protein CFE24_14550 [Flavobacterium sp. BFFFF2]
MKIFYIFIVSVLTSCCLQAQYTAISDPNFEQELINQGIDVNQVADGQVLTSAISNITTLTLNSETAANIVNLEGIQAFTALQELMISAHSLQTINLLQNQFLKKLFIYNPLFSYLNISNNLNLETFYLFFANQMTNIDISSNINLKDVEIGYFNLTQLNVSNNIKLEKLLIRSTQVSMLDITHNTALKNLYCNNNPINLIEVSQNVMLEKLLIWNTPISSIDVSNNEFLRTLDINNTAVQNIDISQNALLEELFCCNNQLSTLNASNNHLLNKVNCNNLNISGNNNNITLLILQNSANTLLNGVYEIGANPPVYLNRFDCTGNPNLQCIFVDDVANCTANWLGKDATSQYVATQQECESLNNEAFSTNPFVLYPNPVKEVLYLENKNNDPIQKIEVFDLTGKKVMELTNAQNQINFTAISAGLYLVKISTSKETITHKIIKIE